VPKQPIEEGYPVIRKTTLREMLEAMSHYKDDEPFRWYQKSTTSSVGVASPDETLLVTMGQARAEILDALDSKTEEIK
jgi:hypothetical protein